MWWCVAEITTPQEVEIRSVARQAEQDVSETPSLQTSQV
jgi:hypothetical protein